MKILPSRCKDDNIIPINCHVNTKSTTSTQSLRA